jgi:hypothetical protein
LYGKPIERRGTIPNGLEDKFTSKFAKRFGRASGNAASTILLLVLARFVTLNGVQSEMGIISLHCIVSWQLLFEIVLPAIFLPLLLLALLC